MIDIIECHDLNDDTKENETKTSNLDTLTPEEEKIVSESIKERPLTEEELQDIIRKSEEEYKSIKPENKISFKSLILFFILIAVLMITLSSISSRREQTQQQIDIENNNDIIVDIQ